MKVAHLLIFGHVQGVGYRQFVKKEARKLGLLGWVRNLPEGTVEAEVAGEEVTILDLIEACRKGSFLAEVKGVEVEWEEKQVEYEGFEIRRDDR